jgi:hypothetical protein
MKLAVASWLYFNPETTVESPPVTPEELMSVFRDQRDVLLKECDWCVGVDSPLPEEAVAEWKQWRQTMRDITKNIVFTENQKWVLIPEPPVTGKPKSWVNLEFDYIVERNQRIHDILTTGIEAGIFQPYPTANNDHDHTH